MPIIPVAVGAGDQHRPPRPYLLLAGAGDCPLRRHPDRWVPPPSTANTRARNNHQQEQEAGDRRHCDDVDQIELEIELKASAFWGAETDRLEGGAACNVSRQVAVADTRRLVGSRADEFKEIEKKKSKKIVFFPPERRFLEKNLKKDWGEVRRYLGRNRGELHADSLTHSLPVWGTHDSGSHRTAEIVTEFTGCVNVGLGRFCCLERHH